MNPNPLVRMAFDLIANLDPRERTALALSVLSEEVINRAEADKGLEEMLVIEAGPNWKEHVSISAIAVYLLYLDALSQVAAAKRAKAEA